MEFRDGEWVEVVNGRFKGMVGYIDDVGTMGSKVILTKNKRTGKSATYSEKGEWIAKHFMVGIGFDQEALNDCVNVTLDLLDAVWFYDLTDRMKGGSRWETTF
ncbi:hypothetical protein HF072_07295 [Bacillus sp. RO3]|nr:hypothetical protein [Bacillus sp. RO3]